MGLLPRTGFGRLRVESRRTSLVLRLRGMLVAVGLLAGLAGCGDSSKSTDDSFPDTLNNYDYRATRELVVLVRRAATLTRELGPLAFDLMRKYPERWTTEDTYIYIYALDGLCLYHGGMPELEGKNLLLLTDSRGKPSLRLAFEASSDPTNPDGWLHFNWIPPKRFYEMDKSSCNYQVTMPDGQRVMVGGGLTEPPEEREFARCLVDSAVRLIKLEGQQALDKIRNPLSQYRYRNISTFVLEADGTTLIDPGIHLAESRNVIDYCDDVGHQPFRNAYERLKTEDRIWLVVLTRSRYERNLVKRAIYLRMSNLEGRDVMVGAVVPVPKPAWIN